MAEITGKVSEGDLGSTLARVRSAVAALELAPGADAELTGQATTFEARIRAALAVLTRSRSWRCSEGPFDRAGWSTTADACA
jgi:hypothetical protein